MYSCTCMYHVCGSPLMCVGPVHHYMSPLCVWGLSITICPPYVCGACPSLYVPLMCVGPVHHYMSPLCVWGLSITIHVCPPYVCGACPSLLSFTVCSAPQVAKATDQQEEGGVGSGYHSKVLLWLESQKAVQGDEACS